jgi:prophage regulatory protein
LDNSVNAEYRQGISMPKLSRLPSEAERGPLCLLRLPEVSQRTGVKRTTIKELVRRGLFPRPVKISPETNARAEGWSSWEVFDWNVERIMHRDAAEAKTTENPVRKAGIRKDRKTNRVGQPKQ